MRIVSWNIELGHDIERAADEILGHVELRDAHVVLVQEMSPQSAATLAERLGMDYLFEAADTHPQTHQPFGNAIMSRWPLQDPQHLLLPHVARVGGQPRSVLLATTTIDGTVLRVGSPHLETVLLSPRRRRLQLDELAKSLQQTSTPLVLGGDFNTASRRSLRAFEAILASANLTRLSPLDSETFRRFRRPFVLDHFFGLGVRPTVGGVVPTGLVSDHGPIWIEYSLDR